MILEHIYNNFHNNLYSIKELNIIINDVNWSYLDNNKKNCPIIVILHGLQSNKNFFWYPLIKHLSKHYRIIFPDLLGHGKTKFLYINEIDFEYTIDNQIRYLHNFLQSVIPNSKFHFIGTSMGSFISCFYTINYPNYILSLSLINIPFYTKDNIIINIYKKNKYNILIPENYKDLCILLSLTFYKKPFIIDNYIVNNFYFPYKQLKTSVYNKIFNQTILSNIFLLENKLNLIKLPILVIWGKNDMITKISSINLLKTNLINLSYINLIDKCGHVPHFEHPNLCFQFLFNHISNHK